MKTKILSLVSGDGMKARAIRGTALSVLGFGGSQMIRLASNLILTRLLFPEAFGLMALMQVFIIGLEQFSDMGIHPAIIQSKRGDDPKFLNTAWTLQILRGFVLWLLACVLAGPIAEFYQQEQLKQIMPVLALSTILTGFRSTKFATANRHLTLGRYTLVDLSSQIGGTIIMILMAWWLESVWALVIGSLASFFLNALLSHVVLPGDNNKLHWDKPAFWEIFHFGKYIVISTIAGYFVLQGDRLVLGKYVTMEDLAVFTIAYLFGSLPLSLNSQLSWRILMPLYSQRPPSESASNYRQIGRARLILIAAFLGLTAVLAFGGDLLITTLYDARYYAAGPMLILLSLASIPGLILDGYKQILISAGNSRNFTIFVGLSAIIKMALLVVMIQQYGIIGAIIAPPLAEIITYPALVYFVRPYRGWYPYLDVFFLLAGTGIIWVALWASPTSAILLMQPF